MLTTTRSDEVRRHNQECQQYKLPKDDAHDMTKRAARRGGRAVPRSHAEARGRARVDRREQKRKIAPQSPAHLSEVIPSCSLSSL